MFEKPYCGDYDEKCNGLCKKKQFQQKSICVIIKKNVGDIKDHETGRLL